MRVSHYAFALWLVALGTAASDIPVGAPLAEIDLATTVGANAADAEWRYHDVDIVPSQFQQADANGQPYGAETTTYDYRPHAGVVAFDDSKWQRLAPEELVIRRGHGRLAFNWYRTKITIPATANGFATAGASVVFESVVDDYAEIWVDGELVRAPAQQGASVVAGWNAPNRVLLTRRATPGQQIEIAIFGINGPISAAPTNYIYLHSARLQFYPGLPSPAAITPAEVNIEVERLDPEIDHVVSRNPKLFKLAEGFQFTEGPVWLPDNTLLFSDPNANTIYRYSPTTTSLIVFKTPSGYSGADVADYGQPGSNGLALDPSGRLTINEHGNHRITRIEPDGELTVLADSFEGRRLNSPNDLVYRSDGALYFTDPPFGLPEFFNDPRKELPYSGVYRWQNQTLHLLAKELKGPNGIAFSPDEKFLYVSNWDETKKIITRYPVQANGDLGAGVVFFDMTKAPGAEALDGLKVDTDGRLYSSGPGGLWIIAADGRHLGTIKAPRLPANFAWGDDGKTLYLTARSALYRLPLLSTGTRYRAPLVSVSSKSE
jgi:gluconolactonase